MRTIIRLAGLAGVLVVAACSGKSESVDDGLKRDLELASAASPITLQNSEARAQVVSAIERTAPPAPKRVARSQRVAKHVPAPRSLPAPVEVEQAEVSEEIEEAPAEVAEAPAEVAPLPSPRPQPVASSGVGGGSGDRGIGRGEAIGAIIGVVLRGGIGGVDECDPRYDGRHGRGGSIAINNRIPVIGTFPAGRIQGTFPGSGRLQAGLPRGGRVRF